MYIVCRGIHKLERFDFQFIYCIFMHAYTHTGDSLFISEPAGSFSVSKLLSARMVVLIAGGSGTYVRSANSFCA